MIELSAKIRKKFGKKVKELRKKGEIPAILYGPEIENLPLEIEEKEFQKVFEKVGESSLIKLKITQEKEEKEIPVLIKEVAQDSIKEKFLHVDFYHPSTKGEIEVKIPLKFEGIAPAVKNLRGTLVKEIQEIEVKGLAQNLPREIKVNLEKLKSFEDKIKVKDLEIPPSITLLRDKEDIVALVLPPEEEKIAPEKSEERIEKEKEDQKSL